MDTTRILPGLFALAPCPQASFLLAAASQYDILINGILWFQKAVYIYPLFERIVSILLTSPYMKVKLFQIEFVLIKPMPEQQIGGYTPSKST